MKTVLKISTGALLFFASMTALKAQVVADVRLGFGDHGSVSIQTPPPAPVPAIYEPQRDRNDGYKNDGYRNDGNRYDSRDLRRDKEELEQNYRIAAGLRERIRSDYDVRDRRAAEYDQNRLHEINERIERLQNHIEKEEREARYERERREHDRYENRDHDARRNGDWHN